MDRIKVVVVGQGYVGLPLAMLAAEAGHNVVGFDIDEKKIGSLVKGRSPIEDVDSAILMQHLLSGRYLAVEQPGWVAGFDVAVITVPTPVDDLGQPDVSYVEAAASTVGKHLNPGATVILESTVAPGTTENLVADILLKESGLTAGRDFHLGFSPERIDPGNKVWTIATTPKIVSGVDATSLAYIDAFYTSMGIETVRAASPATAELAKLIENTYRDVNIALMNELSRHAHAMGVSLNDAIDVASSKPFGFAAFRPGPGVGGHCLPVDPVFLSEEIRKRSGVPLSFIELARNINDSQPHHIVERLGATIGGGLYGARVAVLGYAYKPNTADCRETPVRGLVNTLLHYGASVVVFEPHVDLKFPQLKALESSRAVPGKVELEAFDAIVIATDHDVFDYEAVISAEVPVMDSRNRLGNRSSRHVLRF